MIEKFDAYVGEEPYIFVSYAHIDSKNVIQIISELYREKYRIWYDEGIPLMEDYTETLVDRISNCEVFLIFLTQNSMESPYVQQEIYWAYNTGKKILGIILEETDLLPGFQLILGVTQYIDRTKFSTEREFFDKIYTNEILEKVQGKKSEQYIFKFDERQDKQRKKVNTAKYFQNKICTPCFNAYYQLEVSYFKRRLAGYIAYSIGFDQEEPTKNGGTLYYLRNALPVLTSVVSYGYPNATKEELQVNTDEEAEFATQLAVWSSAIGNKELEEGHRILDIRNLRPEKEYYPYMDRVKNAAKKIIEKALASPRYYNPKLYIDPRNAKLNVYDSFFLAGPYEIKATGFDVSAINIAFDNYVVNVTDKGGIVKKEIKSGDQIYVRINKYEAIHETRMYVYTIGTVTEGRIYGINDNQKEKTNCIVGMTLPVILEDSCAIKWTSQTGNLKIHTIDQFKRAVKGCKFELENADGNIIATAVSDETGCVEWKNISVGTVQLFSRKFSENYITAKEGYNVEIKPGIKEITYQLKKMCSRIEITKIDQNGESVKGAIFELLEVETGIIRHGDTNENGKLFFEDLCAGKFILKEIKAPEGYLKKEGEVKINVPYNKIIRLKFPNKKI